ncbi:RecT Recombinational DNA repair protein (RecE pathway) [uncultured Caudovirales phage]|uniref:RecT Recombinational DNA repair protein (RecE pathway) n=1 Tax=uncultured Caudovirales phage TaxID=2100421 RepID=A0A6J5P1N3_9CAUD|nr:RecT Recombinational DNA repair protein (RecE pathway) [uncultured Caudovirales phage]
MTSATTAITPIDSFRQTLARMQGEFSAALPPQIPADRFIRTVMTAVQMNPKYLNADRRSLLGSCMKAAQDGLLLDGREAALVPFGDALQYMPMIGGILKKIRNSGELSTISANVVYQRDSFEYELGDEERIVHKPYLGEDRGKPVAVYAIAKTKDSAIYREVMSVSEVEKVRRASRAANGPAWTQWWDEMARKTAIKRLAKRLPSSADLDQVIASDNEAVGLATDAPGSATIDPPVLPGVEVAPAGEQPTSRLARSIGKRGRKPKEEVQEATLVEVAQPPVTQEPQPQGEEVTDGDEPDAHF